MMVSAFMILVVCFLPACYGYTWLSGAPYNGSTYYSCVGDSVTFPWAIIPIASERAELEWSFRDNDGNSEVIATYLNDEFLVPHSSQRTLTFAGSVGLIISNLKHEDFGEYSVRVIINGFITETRYAYLRQPDPPRTDDDRLHARMLPNAIFSSGEWQVQLACGSFSSRGSSSFSVKWKTPLGQILDSDISADHDYILKLNNPLEEGNYSCFIDLHEPAARCAHVPPTMLVSNEIHVDECSAQRALFSSAKREIQEITSIFQQFVNLESDTVRLAGGSRPWNGRLEVKVNDTWGAVCSSNYYSSLALVVCRSLRLKRDASYSPQVSIGTTYGTSTLPAHIGYITCNGDEDSIFDCSITYNGQSCYRYYDIGVDCLPRFTLN
ncbi:deleted in malignant brain tumors 1 protein-like isoform X1 [Pomacea canaliculata]|uniref:deleted in malignant brain tumors 1 protein-like isoform X1 n=1 Tax=Pomacea canaliculata TaxID=400727 RepID=UPI000D739244|nr:deleted in malignant brain tumors 1 protein-like isoform X1 [Pomacea canaliculata]